MAELKVTFKEWALCQEKSIPKNIKLSILKPM